MKIIPAIDLKEGNCVRLLQGDPGKQTVYSNDPVQIALRWEDEGASLLHVVDLDGAFQGKTGNSRVIERMASRLNVPFQLGGGLRNKDAVRRAFSLGASRVILGTAAVEEPAFLEEMLQRYGADVVVGLDARKGKIAVKGWTEESGLTALTFSRRMEQLGVREIIYTDIQRDGTLEGPDLSSIKALAEETTLSIIVSGGVSKLKDLLEVKELASLGVTGIIAGKALYSGKLNLKEAIKLAGE